MTQTPKNHTVLSDLAQSKIISEQPTSIASVAAWPSKDLDLDVGKSVPLSPSKLKAQSSLALPTNYSSQSLVILGTIYKPFIHIFPCGPNIHRHFIYITLYHKYTLYFMFQSYSNTIPHFSPAIVRDVHYKIQIFFPSCC